MECKIRLKCENNTLKAEHAMLVTTISLLPVQIMVKLDGNMVLKEETSVMKHALDENNGNRSLEQKSAQVRNMYKAIFTESFSRSTSEYSHISLALCLSTASFWWLSLLCHCCGLSSLMNGFQMLPEVMRSVYRTGWGVLGH